MKNMNLLLGVSILTLASQSAVMATQDYFDNDLTMAEAIELSKRTVQEDQARRDFELAQQMQETEYELLLQPVYPYQDREQNAVHSSIDQSTLQVFEKQDKRQNLESQGLDRQQTNYETIRTETHRVVPGVFHPDTLRQEFSDLGAAVGRSLGDALEQLKIAEKKQREEDSKRISENYSFADRRKFFEKKH